jgi:hypothetical protein
LWLADLLRALNLARGCCGANLEAIIRKSAFNMLVGMASCEYSEFEMLSREGRRRVKLQIIARVEAAYSLAGLSLIKTRCRIRNHYRLRSRDQVRIVMQMSIL